jgi:ribosome maturation factor RimP
VTSDDEEEVIVKRNRRDVVELKRENDQQLDVNDIQRKQQRKQRQPIRFIAHPQRYLEVCTDENGGKTLGTCQKVRAATDRLLVGDLAESAALLLMGSRVGASVTLMRYDNEWGFERNAQFAWGRGGEQ